MLQDIVSNGAFMLLEDLTVPYMYVPYPKLTMEAIYVVDEPTSTQ